MLAIQVPLGPEGGVLCTHVLAEALVEGGESRWFVEVGVCETGDAERHLRRGRIRRIRHWCITIEYQACVLFPSVRRLWCWRRLLAMPGSMTALARACHTV